MSLGVTLAGFVPKAYRIADREAGIVAETSCRKGCAACCRYLVGVSIPEAFYIHRQVAGLAAEEREGLRRRLEATVDALREADLLEALQIGLVRRPDDASWDRRLLEFSRRYAELWLPCPFLSDETCSIYADRPAACRQYLVTSPAELCSDPFNREVRRVSQSVHVGDTLAELTAELTGDPLVKIALPLVLRFAEDYAGLAERRWPEDAFPTERYGT